ncbi:MAG TPA: DNA polymerase IV [Actinomycetota bacterium]|nr:DNA polymerase IV [Actinomycetota bacterium]
MPEPILHVDMDAFYASVEITKDPSLRGKPVVVGGQGGRGVVTSASYEARAFGVTSAMPMIRARRLCPHAVFLPNDPHSYGEYSERIREVFLSFTPLVEPLSLDEAFLDVSGSVKLFGPPVEIARRIKAATAAFGLPCTVGVAPNKFLAKLASSRGKPDGLLVVSHDRIREFLDPLPVNALWGVGAATGEQLRRLGLRTVKDIRTVGRRTLERATGEAMGAHLHALAHGSDDREVVPHEPARSVGSEETFATDLDATDDILREILRLSDRTAGRLRSKALCGRTITLKVRFSNFSTITRSKTSAAEIDAAAEIYDVARSLYLKLDPDRPRIRLLGVSVTGLSPGPARRQLGLLEPAGAGIPEASDAVDRIRARWGPGSVGPATLLDRD